MQKLLIANRGEIAVRIARAAADLGINSVAIYSEDDAASLHVRKADESIALTGRGPRAYLDIEQIVELAKKAGVDAIHPGYGFLSENAAFARTTEAAGVTFVGPTPETLEAFGDKVRARTLAQSCDVPVLEGVGPVDAAAARAFFSDLPHGRFMMIKAVSGGGGRGTRLVRDSGGIEEALDRAASEAASAFGDPALYVEEYLPHARHIEVQVIGDGVSVSHLWERECSLQRRHQKIIEVAPSPGLHPDLRRRILDAAVRMARAVSYRGLGTLEFLVPEDGNCFCFIEGNARLQVEHTVTEEVLVLDLVRAQLEIAQGKKLEALSLDQASVPQCRGFAIEARVNLESFAPDGTVRPGGGRLTAFEPPMGPGVRTDTYGYVGYQTNPAFDSLIAKIICHSPSPDFGDAVRRARRALGEMKVAGAPTNLPFLIALLEDERVAANAVYTGFIDANAEAILGRAQGASSTAGGEVSPSSGSPLAESEPAASHPARLHPAGLEPPEGAVPIRSPMQGTIIRISVELGEAIWPGRTIAVIEAMKMEHEIRSETSGLVRFVCRATGEAVFEGEPLLFLEASDVEPAAVGAEESTQLGSHRHDASAAREQARRSWQDDLDELRRRQAMAEAMGGQEGIARQHRQGKLTARERIAVLADPGSFQEFMSLSGDATYKNGQLTAFTPKPFVTGTLTLDGRTAFVTAGDFTVRGGSGGQRGGMGQELSVTQRAIEWRLPYVRLLDAAGGSVRTFEEIGRTYLPDGNAWTTLEVQALSLVPTVSAVLGSVAGLPAIYACLAHFSVMVSGISQIFPGGPPVVKAALGDDITKEDLGGDRIHTRISGCINNLAQTEADAFTQVRRFLSYLPANVYEMAPRGPTDQELFQAQDAILDIMPRNPRQSYDAHELLRTIVDRDSFFELSSLYGRARITGLARIEGYPVGIMANNPRQNGGLTDVAAGSKVMQLIQLCDTFHLPLVSLADEPGFMVGIEAEKLGIERAGARLVATVCNSRTPWITVVVGKLYGVAGQCHHRPSGMFRRFTWPSANWGSMHITGGVSAAYRREIEAAPDPDAKRREIEARLTQFASPFRTAEATGQDIIDPRETRARLAEFVRDAQRVLATQLGPPPFPYLP